jgi:hypothetical protein
MSQDHLGYMPVLTAAMDSKLGDKWPEYKYSITEIGDGEYSPFITHCGLSNTFPGEAGEQRLGIKFQMTFTITFKFHGWNHWIGRGGVPSENGVSGTGTGQYEFHLVDPLWTSYRDMEYIGIYCLAGRDPLRGDWPWGEAPEGNPVIHFEAPNQRSGSRFIYATHPVETPIPIDISYEWDKNRCEWIYRHVVGGVDYATDIYKLLDDDGQVWLYPKENLTLEDVYCMGSSVAIRDKSFRANHQQVPFIPGKVNFIIENFKQEWTFT